MFLSFLFNPFSYSFDIPFILRGNFPLTLTLSRQGREYYNILTMVMGITSYDGNGSADIILM
jgi:hypothetical protein